MTPLNRRCFATKPTERRQQVDSLSLLPTPERMRCSHTRRNLLQPRGFQDFQVRLVLTVRLRSWWCLKLAQHFPELLCSSLLLRFVQVERCWEAFLRPEPPVPLLSARFGRCRCCFAASIYWQKCQILFCAPTKGASKAGRGKELLPLLHCMHKVLRSTQSRKRRAFRWLAARQRRARVLVTSLPLQRAAVLQGAESLPLMCVYKLIIACHEPESPVLRYRRQPMLKHCSHTISELFRVRNKNFPALYACLAFHVTLRKVDLKSS